MKKKMILLASVLVLAIIVAISILVCPLSFSNVISEKVNHKVDSIGYVGNDTAFSMMDEIKNILDATAPYWENNLGIFPSGVTYR